MNLKTQIKNIRFIAPELGDLSDAAVVALWGAWGGGWQLASKRNIVKHETSFVNWLLGLE